MEETQNNNTKTSKNTEKVKEEQQNVVIQQNLKDVTFKYIFSELIKALKWVAIFWLFSDMAVKIIPMIEPFIK